MSRHNQWFILGDGIAREVITADIQRYLGPDALVRPGLGTGEYEGRHGYWITAYRTLTSNMIQDLRSDSQRWQAERRDQRGPGGGGGDYSESMTHRTRQHYGPTESYAPAARQSAYPQSAYGTSTETSHYTTASGTPYSTPYGQVPQGPTPHPATQQPRTVDQPQYGANYQQSGGRGEYPSYAQPPQYASPPATDPYGRPISAAPQPYTTTSVRPGFYLASDGQQYPIQPQQPQQPPQQPNSGRQRR